MSYLNLESHVGAQVDRSIEVDDRQQIDIIPTKHDTLGTSNQAVHDYGMRERAGFDDVEGSPPYGDLAAPTSVVVPHFNTRTDSNSPLTPLTLSVDVEEDGEATSLSNDNDGAPSGALLTHKDPQRLHPDRQESHSSQSVSKRKRLDEEKASPTEENHRKKMRSKKRNERRAKARRLALARLDESARQLRVSLSERAADFEREPVSYDIKTMPRTQLQLTHLPPRLYKAFTPGFAFADRQSHTRDALVHEHSFRYITWDGRTPKVLVDEHSLVFAALCGQPAAAEWPHVISSAGKEIYSAHQRLRKDQDDHGRVEFPVVCAGVSHGGSRKAPGNLALPTGVAKIMEGLMKTKELARVAGYQDWCLGWYMPKVKADMMKSLRAIFQKHRDLRRPFLNSMYPACCVNFGPQTLCYDHRDFSNAPGVPCAITSMGNFDPMKGGHLVLYDLKVIIEFPPGSTVLLPSGAFRHGNTPVGEEETRSSFTQFCPGGLLRYAACGLRDEKELEEGEKASILGDLDVQWQSVVGLFSLVNELHKDRLAVHTDRKKPS